MSRRRAATKRKVLPDPKFQSELVAKFVNCLMERGKKSIAERIIYGSFDIAAERMKDKLQEGDGDDGKGGQGKGGNAIDPKNMPLIVFTKAINNVSPSVEVKSRRIGGSTYQVPVEIRPDRRLTLAMRWIVDAAKKRSEKNMMLRLAGEIVDAFQNRGTAIKKREDTHRMAKANQAFAHFRW